MRWELLERFLGEACSASERAEVERWLAETPRGREFLDQLVRLIAAANDSASAERQWDRLRREIDAENPPEEDRGPV